MKVERLNDTLHCQEKSKRVNSCNIDISKQISEIFEIYAIPFCGCDYDKVYPNIANILPKESVDFSELSLENCIACEVVCAAICHQMNWDYLRCAVLKKTKEDESWLQAERLSNIGEEEVAKLFVNYKKTERIRAKERTEILRNVGKIIDSVGNYNNIFFDNEKQVLPINVIRKILLNSSVFSKDPKEKKLQLLFQKLSNYESLKELALYCKPAIDYHLIRCYLRRGLIYPRTKYAEEYISATASSKKESTVAALRHLCSELLEQIAWYTELDICVVNAIEWNIARSVCTQDYPDCYLEKEDAAWLKKDYTCCPFFESCLARQSKKLDLLHINEPEYKGTSY